MFWKHRKEIGISGTEQMIFVTVGTHEQQFDRLVKEVDRLRKNGDIEEEVIAQIGFGTYEPVSCQWSRFYPYQKMCEYVDEARIVITHGGPSSFLAPLQRGKVPIVVPRQKQFGEHVNDHQVEFCRAIAEQQRNIIIMEDIGGLWDAVENYDSIVLGLDMRESNNNTSFVKKFESTVEELMQKGKKG